MTITAEILIALALGLVVCFFGYKLKKLAFAIAWFLIGYTLCSHFAPDIIAWMPQLENPDLWMGVLPIAVGLLAALMGLTIERLLPNICSRQHRWRYCRLRRRFTNEASDHYPHRHRRRPKHFYGSRLTL